MTVQADTSRVVWAYHSLDPVSVTSLGSLRHQRQGSISLNLLGGSNEDRVVNNIDSFVIANENVSHKVTTIGVIVVVVMSTVYALHVAVDT